MDGSDNGGVNEKLDDVKQEGAERCGIECSEMPMLLQRNGRDTEKDADTIQRDCNESERE